MTVADLVVEKLKENGVDVVFGIPGSTNGPIVSAIGKKNIRFVLVRNEQSAINAAAGYAKISGKIGVAVIISGPGILNAYPGIVNSFLECIPVLCIVGDISTINKKNSSFQNIDLNKLNNFVKKIYEVNKNSNVYNIIESAIICLESKIKGPIIFSIPSDIQIQNVEMHKINNSMLSCNKEIVKHSPSSTILEKILNKSKYVLICVGQIDAHYKKLFIKIINNFQFPCLFSFGAIGMCRYVAPELNYGIYGEYNFYLKKFNIDGFDTIIFLSDKIDVNIGRPNNIVYIREFINTKFNFKICNLYPISITEFIDFKPNVKRYKRCENLQYNFQEPNYGVSPFKFFEKLYSEISKLNYLVCSEVGQHMVWAMNAFMKYGAKNEFLVSEKLCFMGFSLSATIGALMTKIFDGAVLICGDGSLQMVLSEINTIVENNLNMKIILFNNNCLGMIRNFQKHKANSFYFATSYKNNFNYQDFAKACHIKSFFLRDNINIEGLIKKIFKDDKPCIAELLIDRDLETYTKEL